MKGYHDLPATNYLLIAPLIYIFFFFFFTLRDTLSLDPPLSRFPFSLCFPLWRTGQVGQEQPLQRWLCPVALPSRTDVCQEGGTGLVPSLVKH